MKTENNGVRKVIDFLTWIKLDESLVRCALGVDIAEKRTH
jgi:hypothetical protein